MKILQVLSSTAAAGKTVWVVGVARALREAGLRVAVFKAVSEDEVGYEVHDGRVSLAALHLMAASGIRPTGKINPVLLIPNATNRAEVWLLGKYLGTVARLGRDTGLLNELSSSIQTTIMSTTLECLDEIGRTADIVIAEGSGSASDLTLMGAWDLANIEITKIATSAILVARSSSGGSLASFVGTVSLLPYDAKTKLRGLVLNDVRHNVEDITVIAHGVAAKLGLTFLGATPWISFFEGRPRYEPFTPESDEDHKILGQAISESINLPLILQWMNISK